MEPRSDWRQARRSGPRAGAASGRQGPTRACWLLVACLGALFLYAGSARCQALELVFDRIWAETRDHLEDTTLASRHFTKASYSRLREKAQKAEDIDALAGLFNPFLDSLHVSHTHLSTPSDLEYYAYAITASPRQLDTL